MVNGASGEEFHVGSDYCTSNFRVGVSKLESNFERENDLRCLYLQKAVREDVGERGNWQSQDVCYRRVRGDDTSHQCAWCTLSRIT